MLGHFEFKRCNIILSSAKHPQNTRMLSNTLDENMLTNARRSRAVAPKAPQRAGSARPAELRSAIWPQAIFSFYKPRGNWGEFSEIVSTCVLEHVLIKLDNALNTNDNHWLRLFVVNRCSNGWRWPHLHSVAFQSTFY